MTNTEYVTMADLDDLRKARNECIDDNRSSFFFKGHELDREYAKYMIEYLELELMRREKCQPHE